ncbi:MAG: helix-turn-helix domain-containing protein [Planctomycetota bacterium]|jgi:transcriptional regulator with XRE-family HTH domain
MDYRRIIAHNIKAARELSGISQQEVAEALGLGSHSAVSKMESGDRRVCTTELAILAQMFGKSVEWFFDPEATREDFVTLARARGSGQGVEGALREAERLVENFLLLRKLLGKGGAQVR